MEFDSTTTRPRSRRKRPAPVPASTEAGRRRGEQRQDAPRASKALAANAIVGGLALLLTVTGCSGDTLTRERLAAVDDLRPMLTGSAVAALACPTSFLPTATLGSEEMTEGEATEFARRFVASYGRLLIPDLRSKSATKVEFEDLHVCRQSAIARPVSQPTAGSERVRRRQGPHWLVSVCQGDGIQVLSLSFSVYARDVAAARPKDGILNPDGSDLLAIPVLPVSQQEGVPGSAERAVSQLVAAIGLRITEPPALEQPEYPYAPQLARWAFSSESPASFRRDGTFRIEVGTKFLVGPSPLLGPSYVLARSPNGVIRPEPNNAIAAGVGFHGADVKERAYDRVSIISPRRSQ